MPTEEESQFDVPALRAAVKDNDQEALIALGVAEGAFIDFRAEMPYGVTEKGARRYWRQRRLSDILGGCFHQGGSSNYNDPARTGRYHASKANHITLGRALPGLCYDWAVPNVAPAGYPSNVRIAWLVSDLTARKYAQGSAKHPGDENTHLTSCLIMGSYDGPGFKGDHPAPSPDVLAATTRLWEWQKAAFGFGDWAMFGHYDFGKAACPGYAVQAKIEYLRSRAVELDSPLDWQRALLRWDSQCLPKYGADGKWGAESSHALSRFQGTHGLPVNNARDPFTELVILKKYPPPDVVWASWSDKCETCGFPNYRRRHAPLLKLVCSACTWVGCSMCTGASDCPVCGRGVHTIAFSE